MPPRKPIPEPTLRYDWSEYARPKILDPDDPDGWYPDEPRPGEARVPTVEESRRVEAYRKARDTYLAAQALADEAWDRWFQKRHQGIATNGAQASRLANEASYLSADLASAQDSLYSVDLTPEEVDRIDGVTRTISYG